MDCILRWHVLASEHVHTSVIQHMYRIYCSAICVLTIDISDTKAASSVTHSWVRNTLLRRTCGSLASLHPAYKLISNLNYIT
eukprot:21040-Eustigmatos_ZCMA.PRE.1